MKNVFITIKGSADTDGQNDLVEFATEGTMSYTEDEIILCYNEGENLGVNGVKTTLTVNSEGAVMERSGGLSSRLEIIKGRRNSCIYSTAYGDMQIGVYGQKIENELTPIGGRLVLGYALDQGLKPISNNEIEITVKEV